MTDQQKTTDVQGVGSNDLLYVPCNASRDEARERILKHSREFREILRLALDPPEECRLEAHHTGDGWSLAAVDKNGEVVCYLAFPKAWGESINSNQLRSYGFEVV